MDNRGTTRRALLAGIAVSLLLVPLPGHSLEKTDLLLGGKPFRVELAVTRSEQQQGLMHRDRLPAGTGMLFILDPPRPTRFWNKNVHFPIDILYFDSNRAYLGADTHVLPCPYSDCPIYRTGQAVKYVLELPAGTHAQLNLLAGDKFIFR
ncbi:hypothetical protein EDC23_0282 [Thiohalophilus thiocyanatoxydans]|uniref:DUF192 domain-containing protein n=1 Tax=Thiohalophilus thiocyanatoxydans TaxID=381308 RepID=A0A4R8IS96_9GAMM|nr:hypothetical protein EDC23_0282 [Thiohalophilus thiocyanatoxydans]